MWSVIGAFTVGCVFLFLGATAVVFSSLRRPGGSTGRRIAQQWLSIAAALWAISLVLFALG